MLQRSNISYFVRATMYLLVSSCVLAGFLFVSAQTASATGTYTQTGSMAGDRHVHTATLLPDGDVLVVAGSRTGDSNGYTGTAERYDPATETWSSAGSIPFPRSGHSAVLLQNGLAMVAGGNTPNHIDDVRLYDYTTNTWTQVSSMIHERERHSATVLQDGTVLVAGGLTNSGFAPVAEVYDPATDTWSTAGAFQDGEFLEHTATLLQDGRVLVIGGFDFASSTVGQIYDPATGTWTSTSPLTVDRSGHTATLLPNGKVLVAGGFDAGASVELYDPVADTWTPTGSLPSANWGFKAILLDNGNVLTVGGGEAATILLYDIAAGTWSDTGLMPASVPFNFRNHTLTKMTDGRVLVAGGDDAALGVIETAHIYTPAAPPNQPPVFNLANQMVDEGQLLSFSATATDPDGDNLTYSASGLPTGATYSSTTGQFDWTPDFDDAGVYNVTFTAIDDGTPSLSASTTITITVNNVPQIITVYASQDAFMRQGSRNRNEGANPLLHLGQNRRQLVGFDLTGIDTSSAVSAELILTINDDNDPGQWGSSGRLVAAHSVTETWAEGDGKGFGLPGSQSTRGSGDGVTWKCAIDTAIENQATDCSPVWDGGNFAATATDEVLHTNGMTGEVNFDVTADVTGGDDSWLIKKSNEGQNGNARYYSRDHADVTSNPDLAPRLVLTI